MSKFLLSNGCSFLAKRKGVNRHTGVLLAEDFGLTNIDLAACGRGNDRIVITTKLFFYERPEIAKDTFVIIGWSNPARIDYINNYHEEKGWTKTGKWGESWFSLKDKLKKEPHWSTYKKAENHGNTVAKMFRQTLELQDFFENMGIKYCMYHSLDMLPYGTKVKLGALALLKDNINEDRFYALTEQSHATFICSKKPKLVVSKEDLHPSEEGHEAWAKNIKTFIENNNLL